MCLTVYIPKWKYSIVYCKSVKTPGQYHLYTHVLLNKIVILYDPLLPLRTLSRAKCILRGRIFFVIFNKSQSDRIKRNQVEFYMVLFYMPSKCELKGRMYLVVLNGSKTHDKSIVNIFYWLLIIVITNLF